MWDRRSQSLLLVFLGDNNSIELKFSYFLLDSRGLVVDLRNSLVRMSFSYLHLSTASMYHMHKQSNVVKCNKLLQHPVTTLQGLKFSTTK